MATDTTTDAPTTDAEMRERLIDALLTDDDDTFSRAQAAMHLNTEHPETFPIRDEANDQWILSVERDRLDGVSFIGRETTIQEGHDPCPECGNTRRRVATFNNGIVSGYRETCTVCDHVHAEDVG